LYLNKSPELAALVPPAVMTNRFQGPVLARPPVMAVISVLETTFTFVAGMAPVLAPCPCPMTTLAPGTKCLPVIVIGVLPVVGPELGDTALTVGGVTEVNSSPELAAQSDVPATTS
jgi:hypothetical protein